MISQLTKYYIKGTLRKLKKMTGDYGSDPYMKYKEIDLFTELLENLRPEKILEYGCGYSTLYYPDLLPASASWISVEHNEDWFEQIAPKIDRMKSNVKVFIVKPDIANYPDDGYYEHFKTYVDFPRQYAPFDLILVDGMARESCIEKGMDMLAPGGVLVIHDCNREKYQKHIKKFPHWAILEDFRKTAGGFGFGRKSSLDELIDLKHHANLWKADTRINNIFKFKYLIGKKSKPFRLKKS